MAVLGLLRQIRGRTNRAAPVEREVESAVEPRAIDGSASQFALEQERKLPHLRPFAGEAVPSAAHAAEVYDHARRRGRRWRRAGLGTNGRRGAETRSERAARGQRVAAKRSLLRVQ